MIEFTEQTVLFWKIAHDLVVNHNYRVLKFNDDGELWLESTKKRESHIIRLLRYDIDWSNWLVRDSEQLNKQVAQLKKYTFRGKVTMYNVYVSTYPPVDDWKSRIEPHPSVETFLIESEMKFAELNRLYQKLKFKQDFYNWDLTNPEVISVFKSKIKTEMEMKQQEERNLLLRGKPLFTYVFIIINVLMFMFLEWKGGSTNTLTLIEYGAKYNPLIIEGEWWRLITPIFLHIGFLHLFMNSFALYYLGMAVERIYGSFRFLLIYLVAGIIGATASFAFNTQVSAGASGAIFGCFGALLYFGTVHPKLFFRTMGMNLLVVLGINIAFGFVVPMIDNGAHIGGLVGGFIASGLLHLPKHQIKLKQLGYLISLCMIGYLLFSYGFINDEAKQVDPMVEAQIANQLIKQDKIVEANQILSKLEQNQENLPAEVYFLLSFTEIKLNQLEPAFLHLQKTIELREDFHEAHYNLALIYYDFGEYEKSRASVEKALSYEPKDENYKELLETLNEAE